MSGRRGAGKAGAEPSRSVSAWSLDIGSAQGVWRHTGVQIPLAGWRRVGGLKNPQDSRGPETQTPEANYLIDLMIYLQGEGLASKSIKSMKYLADLMNLIDLVDFIDLPARLSRGDVPLII